ncbi:MAG: hypothetical protein K2P93_08540 [Alphaproteobacteria bacterium]|nr:hypothetical protein [Alphaproteobacteria bacterium]
MRFPILLLTLLLPLSTWAECPDLVTIKGSLKDIREHLRKNSEENLMIKGVKYKVRHEEDSPAVDDLLAGNFEGYIIDRLKETVPGECHYQVRDDRTPVRGHFILYQQK